jgi:alpha-D-ribose 1-methylphosphonate 5-triphosphate diphosphatase
MPNETVFINARIVLLDQVVDGSVRAVDGKITDIGGATATGEDFEGDFLVPGLIELHTDHLEGHYAPRPGVRWNPVAALQAHDAQVAASGITTVFDALRVGMDDDSGMLASDMRALGDAIHAGTRAGRLRADHYIHLRCEVSAPDCLQSFAHFETDPLVRLASLMDHAPGQRQFASVETYRNYYQKKRKMTDAEFESFCTRRMRDSATYAARHRLAISERCADEQIALASHDDATTEQVAEAHRHGTRVAEFPTTLEAAEASRKAGMSILMGAPNVVRGASHSGNVSARELAEKGLLDILSSDYVPLSLMQAAFHLDKVVPGLTLQDAMALVSKNPATALGLGDRGEIAIGKRADLARVRLDDGVPVVRSVWREGRRVI